MVNSHYIPQLILRHFCENEKILYYDIEKQTTESRTAKSVFSEKGYYPEELEKDLCHNIEVQFANILNRKILCENYKIALTAEELLILKKYLIITILRVKDEDLVHNAWYQVLKRDGFIPEDNSQKDFFGGGFFENINRILECRELDELLDVASNNMNLFTFIKDIVYSYNVFVKTNNCKEDFIISDRGWAGYRGPMSVKKLNAMLNMLEVRYDPYIDMLLNMSSPQDYAIFPLANNMAIITVSPAFKICLPGAPYNIIYPDNADSLSKCLGFGNANTIAMPDNKFLKDGTKEYRYKIQQLTRQDVAFLNELLVKNAEKFIGFANSDKVRLSLEKCNITV
ncbi:MAG: DUF4238 domain-containing protein [Lachnospiraceae bacterium]|nr:DUF4238 domain-containing protein [Lachnospiraceae bacterium]